MNNTSVRIEMAMLNIKQWQLARILGISESTLCRKLREELPPEEQIKIIQLMRNKIKAGEIDADRA